MQTHHRLTRTSGRRSGPDEEGEGGDHEVEQQLGRRQAVGPQREVSADLEPLIDHEEVDHHVRHDEADDREGQQEALSHVTQPKVTSGW